MKKDLNNLFVENGVYQLKNSDSVFVCSKSNGCDIGKLTLYNNIAEGVYEVTKTQYFLNDYPEGDIKEIFVTRENYDMLGIIGSNFNIKNKYLVNCSLILKG